MNRKHQKNKLLDQNNAEFWQIQRKEYTFCFTEQYIRKNKIQRYTIGILFPILFFGSYPIAGLLWDRSRFVGLIWAFYMVTIFGILIKYGVNRTCKNAIKIQNHQIYYSVPRKASPKVASSGGETCFVFQLIEKVEVKRSIIVIHGYIVERGYDRHVVKKMTIPRELENVDEFIRLAQSMVV